MTNQPLNELHWLDYVNVHTMLDEISAARDLSAFYFNKNISMG